MESLADVFIRARTSPVDWQGEPIYAAYEFLETPERLAVSFVSFAPEPVQGLRFKIRGGSLRISGQIEDEFTLWVDTAPSFFEIDIERSRGKPLLRVWNVWRTASGIEQAWLNNAAMKVSESLEGGVLLRCSDGVGPPAFDDFVVHMSGV